MQKIICRSSGSFCMTMIPCYNHCIQVFHQKWRSKINNDEDTLHVSREAATCFPNNSMQHLNSLKTIFHELPFMHLTLHTKKYVLVFLCPQTVTHQWFIQFIACSISTMHCVLSKGDFVQIFFVLHFFPTSEEAEKNIRPDQQLCCREAFDF